MNLIAFIRHAPDNPRELVDRKILLLDSHQYYKYHGAPSGYGVKGWWIHDLWEENYIRLKVRRSL